MKKQQKNLERVINVSMISILVIWVLYFTTFFMNVSNSVFFIFDVIFTVLILGNLWFWMKKWKK